MKQFNQHFVTASYIRAWRDPETPDGSFVWVVDKRTQEIQRKSPKKLFVAPDFYTVYDDDGARILELEDELSKIEGDFMNLRKNKLGQQIPLTPEDRIKIALFISTMFSRTNYQKQNQQEIWEQWFDEVDELPREMSDTIKDAPVYDGVRQLLEQPMPFHMFHFVNTVVPYLVLMNCAIYEVSSTSGFITSDNPVFWFDPAVYDPTSPLTFFGVGSPTLTIDLPISPHQMIHLETKGPEGYVEIPGDNQGLDYINRLALMNSDEFIVANKPIANPFWFQED